MIQQLFKLFVGHSVVVQLCPEEELQMAVGTVVGSSVKSMFQHVLLKSSCSGEDRRAHVASEGRAAFKSVLDKMTLKLEWTVEGDLIADVAFVGRAFIFQVDDDMSLNFLFGAKTHLTFDTLISF